MMINFRSASLIIILALGLLVGTSGAQQCGKQYANCNCPEGYCCSNYGYCGKTDAYCATGNCQCQCPAPSPPPPPPPPYTPPPPVSPDDVSNIVSKDLFEEMLLHRNDDPHCAIGFYTYEGFITAARRFPEFGATGTLEDRKREIAAFFGQTSHETTGAGTGWVNPPDGPYTWGYCFVREVGTPPGYCVPSTEWPCVPGQDYYGRGPIQLSYNYNYGLAGAALGVDLLHNPDMVATDVALSFETALWFWMTPQAPKPSCHDVITDQWTPSQADKNANRLPGYGLLTNIINGGRECGNTGPDGKLQEDRIGFYLRYCELLGVSPGDNLDCYNQTPYGVTLRNNPKYGILKMPTDQA